MVLRAAAGSVSFAYCLLVTRSFAGLTQPSFSGVRLCRRTWRKGSAFPVAMIDESRLRLERRHSRKLRKKQPPLSRTLTAVCCGKAA